MTENLSVVIEPTPYQGRNGDVTGRHAISAATNDTWHGLMTLPVTVAPDPREGALGFIRRLAMANGLPPRMLVKLLEKEDRTSWGEEAMTRLRQLAFHQDIFENEYQSFARPHAGLRWVPSAILVLGQPVRPSFLTYEVRVCPACIAVYGRMKEFWNVLYATACVEHGLELISHCSCGRGLAHDRVRKSWECRCGNSWLGLESKRASEEAIAISRWIASTFGEIEPAETTCPKPWIGADAMELLTAIGTIGVATLTDAADDPWTNSYLSRATRHKSRAGGRLQNQLVFHPVDIVESAHPILSDWPNAYTDVLKSVAFRNQKAMEYGTQSGKSLNVKHIFSTAVGMIVSYPPLGSDGFPNARLFTAFERYVETDHSIFSRKRKPLVSISLLRDAGNAASISELGRRLGVHPRSATLRKSYDEAVASFADYALDKADIAELIIQKSIKIWNDFHKTISGSTVTKILEHPNADDKPYAWTSIGLLSPVETIFNSGHRKNSFLISDVTDVLTKLQSHVKDISEFKEFELMSYFETVEKLCNASNYDKGNLIQDIFSGRLIITSRCENPKLFDIIFYAPSVENIAQFKRIRHIIESDNFSNFSIIRKLVYDLWRHPLPCSNSDLVRAFAQGKLRRATKTYKSKQRKSLQIQHRYSIVDEIRRQAQHNPTTRWSAVDAIIRENFLLK